MLEKVGKIYLQTSNNKILLSLLLAITIGSGIYFSTIIPIVVAFLYICLFNKNYLFGVILTLPIYDAYFTDIPISINKIVFVVVIVVLLIDVKYKNIQLNRNELWIFLLIAMASIGVIVAVFNSDLIFIRDSIEKEYLLETLPKLLFVLLLSLATKSSQKYNIKKLVENATIFISFFMIVIAVNVAITSRDAILNVGPNFFAVFTMIFIPFTFYLYFKTKSKLMVIVTLSSAASLVYILGVTNSRTGILILLFGILTGIIIFYKLNRKRALILIGLALIGITLMIIMPYFKNLLIKVLRTGGLNNIVGMLNGRYELYQSAIQLILRNPLVGYGGSKDTAIILLYNDIGIPQVAHSIYLEIILQYGVYGTIIFAFIYGGVFSEFFIKINKKFIHQNYWQLPVYLSFFSLLIAGLLLSINFRDIYIYLLALVFVLPKVDKIGGVI